MSAKYIIGGVVILVFIVWAAMSFTETTIQYVSIDKAMHSNKTVQVMGKIDFDNVNYNADDTRLEFSVYDADAPTKENAQAMNVVYYGVVPGNFDQATSVVLKGKQNGDHFEAEQMLVKCPSKYQGEGGEFQNMEKHNEAVGETGV